MWAAVCKLDLILRKTYRNHVVLIEKHVSEVELKVGVVLHARKYTIVHGSVVIDICRYVPADDGRKWQSSTKPSP